MTLASLFGAHSQLIIYHFMFAQGWKEGCPHCAFSADHYDAMLPHLAHHDVGFGVVSRASLSSNTLFQHRMGWKFPRVSSQGTDFNYDYHVSFRPEDVTKGAEIYTYRKGDVGTQDRESLSVFYKDARGRIFHTYSTNA